MYTNTHVPPGGTAGERLPAPRQALAPHQHFETLDCCPYSIRILHRLPSAPTQADAPLVMQGVRYSVGVF